MPQVSVVVPVYNCYRYLKKCVDSLKNQTLKDLEIILVDDGSSDGSEKLCDQLAESDSRIYVIHQINKGVSAARNAGIIAAHGEYIGFCDADDFCEPDKFEIQYSNAKKYDADVSVVGLYTYFSEHHKIAVHGTNKFYYWKKGDTDPIQFGLEKRILTMAPYCMIVRQPLCNDILFEEGRAVNEDRFFGFMAYAKADGICYQDICKYNYVQRSGSVAHSGFSKKFFDCIYFAEKMENYVRNELPVITTTAQLNTCKTYIEVLKYLLKEKDGLKKYPKESTKILNKIRSYGFLYLYKKLDGIRFLDAILMSRMPKLYMIIIHFYMHCKKRKPLC